MKCFIILTTVLLALSIVEAGKFSGIIKAIAGPCKTKENASNDDLDKLAEGEEPQTKEGKCLAACLGEQFGILKDNKISKEGIQSKMGGMVNDEEKKKSIEKLIDACADVTNEDRCEAASEIWQCIKKEGDKLKLKMF